MKNVGRSVALVVAAAACAACSASGGDIVSQSSEPITIGATYNFGTLAHPGACLDARASGTANGTQIQEYWCNGSGAQAFAVQNAGNGAYYLVNTNASKCVDVQARGTANGTKIQLYDCNQTVAQTFLIQPAANGFVTLVNTNSGKCLDVQADNPADGTVVQLYDCNGSNAQLWNPAAISGSPGGGGSGGGGSGGGTSNGVAVKVTNGCPVDVWIHAVGQQA
ncbi:MAG TPA: RICIN domain-containing protein, partial [Polyangiaceae bacterium]